VSEKRYCGVTRAASFVTTKVFAAALIQYL
jgi:hypothetical protein